MQKAINLLAVLSFMGTVGIIGTGTVVYLRRDAIAERVTEKITKAATAAIADALPGMMDAAMPELPNATGTAIPFGYEKTYDGTGSSTHRCASIG